MSSEPVLTEHKVTANITHHAGSSYVRVCGQLYNVPEHYERLATGLTTILAPNGARSSICRRTQESCAFWTSSRTATWGVE